jgi:hypothetical protein
VEVIASGPGTRTATRPGARPGTVVGTALAVLAAGQAWALTGRGLDGVDLVVRDGGYTVATPADSELVSFQLDTTGRPADLVGVEVDVPGLELVDVVVSGSDARNRELGAGPAGLPRVRLESSATLSLRFRVTDCDAVDSAPHPVRLRLEQGRRSGTVALALRDYPDPEGAGPDLRWQQVLQRAGCPAGRPT